MFINSKWFPVAYETSGEGSGGSGEQSPDPAREGKQQQAPPAAPPAQPSPEATSEVAKAYEKLRAAETELKTVKKDAERVPNLQSENEQLKAENAELKQKQQEASVSTVLTAKARDLNFHRPDRAFQALKVYTDVDPLTLTDETKVEKALRDLASSEEHLVGSVPPSGGPVHTASENVGGNAAVNRAIRSAAGR
jgi:hypothetical protein